MDEGDAGSILKRRESGEVGKNLRNIGWRLEDTSFKNVISWTGLVGGMT